MSPRTIVVGAGIAGLARALSLEAEGLPVEIYEAVSEVRARGVGINLPPHGVRELDALVLLPRCSTGAWHPPALLHQALLHAVNAVKGPWKPDLEPWARPDLPDDPRPGASQLWRASQHSTGSML